MNYRMSTKELEFWLNHSDYSIPEIRMTRLEVNDKNYRMMEKANRVLGRSFHHTFEKWFKQFGSLPTPQEFVTMQMVDFRKCFENESWRRKNRVYFELTPIVEKGLKQRLLRSYKSFIVELHTELTVQEQFPNLQIVRNDELDFEGVDLCLKDRKNKIEHNIHITKNSEYAIDFLFTKEGKELEFRGYGNQLFARPNWKQTNHPIYSQRSFKGHTFFLYSECDSDDIKVVNGYPLFRLEYIKNKIEVSKKLKMGV